MSLRPAAAKVWKSGAKGMRGSLLRQIAGESLPIDAGVQHAVDVVEDLVVGNAVVPVMDLESPSGSVGYVVPLASVPAASPGRRRCAFGGLRYR